MLWSFKKYKIVCSLDKIFKGVKKKGGYIYEDF